MQAREMLVSLVVATLTPVTFAVDSACSPIITASEKKMTQSTWHSIATLTSGRKLEFIKTHGSFYSNTSGSWQKLTTNLDSAEKEMIGKMRSGEIKLTNCKQAGSEAVDGTPTDILSITIEMPGAPAADSKLYVGKSDGLPYRQSSKGVEVVYKYKNIAAPKS